MYFPNETPSLYPPLNAVRIEEPGVSIRDYVDLLIEGRTTIIKSLLVILLLATVYWLLAPRTYKADAMIRIDKNKALLTAPLRSDPDPRPAEADNPRAQREVEILRSRFVLGKVVEELDLTVEYSPWYFPIIGETLARWHDAREGLARPWWGSGRWAWGGEKLKIAAFTVPERYLNEDFTLIALQAGRFRLLGHEDRILAEGKPGERLASELGEEAPIVLEIEELQAHPGTRFTLTKRTTLTAIEDLKKAIYVQEVSKDTDLLKVELKGRIPDQLAEQVNNIATIYVDATVKWESAEAAQKLSFLEAQLPIVKERLEKAEQELSGFRKKHGAVDISTEAEVLLKQAAEMETMSIRLKQKYEQQNQWLQDAHPDMLATQAQMRRVNGKLASLEKRIKELPNTQQRVVSLSRDVQVNTELYTSLLNSAQEQRIAAAGSLGTSRILDFAVVPEKPYWPKPGLLFAIAALLGLTAGTTLVLLRNSLQRHDNYPAFLEHQVGLPLYAAIPHSRTQCRLARLTGPDRGGQHGVLVSQDPLDISVESLRALRTTLEATLSSNESQVILVSSPVPGMGKSFISTNLSVLLASIKKRVLIIDADMRNGRMHENFSVGKQPGLSDLLSGTANLGEIIISLPREGVDFIPRGRIVMNPAELLVLGGLEQSLEQLKSFYNHIVIDSPPILGATDAAILGKYADATFLVVKESRHAAQELEVSCRRFQQVGIKTRGFIINDLKEGSSSPYYGYAYHRAYSDAKKVSRWEAFTRFVREGFKSHEDRPYLLDSEIIEQAD
ncbi:MAG: polysaccharide biosynthesis tyrosine autokinase [Gammaproteobacteria bacterium]